MITDRWTTALVAGCDEEAWDLFLAQYRALIFATIRHCTKDNDDVMDAFASLCEALRKDDFARLRQCAARWDSHRPMSTWIVAVIRNLLIDQWRHRHGRQRPSAARESLPPMQQHIADYVFVRKHSHVEAYELLCSRDGLSLTFREFLRELGATYRSVPFERAGFEPAEAEVDPDEDPALVMDRHARLEEAMSILSAEDRVAVQLYVIEGMPAIDVARILGATGAKAVYNRVYRALSAIRAHLEKAGIRDGDL
jgi:RNA polymerase sigma factor (sigma-70 family)